MKTEYISLTEAIALFEEYKLDYLRNSKDDIITSEGEYIGSIIKFDPTTDFLFHIQSGKINLYGKLWSEKTVLKKIPDVITSKIQCIEPIFVFSIISYVIYNNYDYKESYNPSVNYDVLRSTSTLEDIYTELSVEYKELVELIKSIFKEEETNE